MGGALEMMSVFVLVNVYNILFSDINAPSQIIGAAIGGIYLMAICAFGMISGGCLNLACLLGPSLFSSNFRDWPYYISG